MEKNQVPCVGSNPAGPLTVPVPPIDKKPLVCTAMNEEARLKVNPPTDQSGVTAVEGLKTQGAVKVTGVFAANPANEPEPSKTRGAIHDFTPAALDRLVVVAPPESWSTAPPRKLTLPLISAA